MKHRNFIGVLFMRHYIRIVSSGRIELHRIGKTLLRRNTLERTVTQVSGVLLSAVLFACMCNAQPAEIPGNSLRCVTADHGQRRSERRIGESGRGNGRPRISIIFCIRRESWANWFSEPSTRRPIPMRRWRKWRKIKNSGTSHTVVGPYSSEPVGIPGKSLLKSVFPSENRPLGRFLYRGARIFSSPIRIL